MVSIRPTIPSQISQRQSDASPAELLSLSPKKRAIWESLTRQERAALEYTWRGFLARPKQLAPQTDWRVWLILAGRGFGKSRTGAEWTREVVGPPDVPSKARIALVARTAADVRDVMIEGESGILAISPPWNRPKYEPSKRRLTWPNGAMATTYTADKPDQLRGPQHTHGWADELAAWRYTDAWDQLMFGLRLGDSPRAVVTTTPRPTPLVRALLSTPTTAVTRGSTYENKGNLASAFLEQIVTKYEGTRLGRQELHAEVLDDAPGALWKRDQIDLLRVRHAPPMRTIVVAIDPAVSSNESSNETGIIVFGVGEDRHGYVLDDLSGVYTPHEWATKAVWAYNHYDANSIVAEVNQGGDLVEANLRTVSKTLSFTPVRAARGKHTRAEPVAGLYEQGRIHHVGLLATLEDQMCTWEPASGEGSPDRMDALVWGATYTLVEGNGSMSVTAPSSKQSTYRLGSTRGF